MRPSLPDRPGRLSGTLSFTAPQAWQLAEHRGERVELHDTTVPQEARIGGIEFLREGTQAWAASTNESQRGGQWQLSIEDVRKAGLIVPYIIDGTEVAKTLKEGYNGCDASTKKPTDPPAAK